MQGCHHRLRLLRVTVLVTLLGAALVTVLGAQASSDGLRVRVEPDLANVFAALAGAYDGALELVDDGADLVLARGGIDWRNARSVALTSDVRLTRQVDSAEARALQRFATAPAGQRSLIEAGLLPSAVTITDQGGRTFELAQPVERLASPYALATYLAYAVGAGDRIVLGNFLGARDPQGAAAMERIDPRFRELGTLTPEATTNVEHIASIAPDLVFATTQAEWAVPIRSLGIPIIGFASESSEGLREAMRIAGRALGPDAEARAEAWIAYYDHVLASVERATLGSEMTPRVLFTGTERTRVASGAMYQRALIEAAGGVSVTAHLTGQWNDVDVEQVLAWNPDVILVPQYGRASVVAILEDPQWRLLDAVRAGRVLRVPKLVAPWDTPVPDSVLAIVWLAEQLHGDLHEVRCERETRFFYERFYGYAITGEEVAALCHP